MKKFLGFLVAVAVVVMGASGNVVAVDEGSSDTFLVPEMWVDENGKDTIKFVYNRDDGRETYFWGLTAYGVEIGYDTVFVKHSDEMKEVLEKGMEFELRDDEAYNAGARTLFDSGNILEFMLNLSTEDSEVIVRIDVGDCVRNYTEGMVCKASEKDGDTLKYGASFPAEEVVVEDDDEGGVVSDDNVSDDEAESEEDGSNGEGNGSVVKKSSLMKIASSASISDVVTSEDESDEEDVDVESGEVKGEATEEDVENPPVGDVEGVKFGWMWMFYAVVLISVLWLVVAVLKNRHRKENRGAAAKK